MVEVQTVERVSDRRQQRSSAPFPADELSAIEAAVAAVPDAIFLESDDGVEIRRFDGLVADGLEGYEREHLPAGGRNPACKLWAHQGFDHSVDCYHPERRIAVEIEKSERKRISDDVLKFIKGGKTRRDGRPVVAFGCLIVPTNYRGSGNLVRECRRTLAFVRSVLFVEDVAVVGYVDPRWT